MPVHENTIGEEYDELKAYCAVLENENNELECELEKLSDRVDDLAITIRDKDAEIEKLTKIIRCVEVIMGGKILDDN